MVADHQRAGIDQVEARANPPDRESQSSRSGQLGVGKYLAQPLDLALVVTGDQHIVAGGRAIELRLDLGQFTGEPFDALDPQMAGRLQ